MSAYNMRGSYNQFNDPRNWDGAFFTNLNKKYAPQATRGVGKIRYRFSKCRKTRSRMVSNVKQKTITAPISNRTETKYLDYKATITGIKYNANAGPTIIGEIPGGSTEGQRIGNDIRVMGYYLSVQYTHGSSVVDQTFRFILFRYKTGNSSTSPGISDLLNGDASGLYTPSSFRSIGSLEDYEILLDKTTLIDSNYASNHGLRVWNARVTTCFPQRYAGTAASGVIKNPVFYVILTNAPNVTTGAVCDVSIRTMYTDV